MNKKTLLITSLLFIMVILFILIKHNQKQEELFLYNQKYEIVDISLNVLETDYSKNIWFEKYPKLKLALEQNFISYKNCALIIKLKSNNLYKEIELPFYQIKDNRKGIEYCYININDSLLLVCCPDLLFKLFDYLKTMNVRYFIQTTLMTSYVYIDQETTKQYFWDKYYINATSLYKYGNDYKNIFIVTSYDFSIILDPDMMYFIHGELYKYY